MSINFISSDLRKQLKKIEKKQRIILKLTKVFFVLGVIFLFLSFAPSIWYSITSKVDDYSISILNTVSGKSEVDKEKPTVQIPNWQPAFNSALTRETTLKIPSIGVDTKVNERTYQDYEEALKLGVWRVPDFGTPLDRSKPVILAAHRFGYLAWTNLYRRKNSFYNLPKLKTGDLIEVVYKQRKYTYEVYGEARGEEITDYSANLILYTCETLNSKVRIFKYARLLQI
jgi:sortase (surface protein transpeptidase)